MLGQHEPEGSGGRDGRRLPPAGGEQEGRSEEEEQTAHQARLGTEAVRSSFPHPTKAPLSARKMERQTTQASMGR